MTTETNPLVDDRLVDLLLHDVHDAVGLCALPAFAEHSRETFEMYVGEARRLARAELFASYRPMDEEPPRFVDGRVLAHPRMKELYPRLVELGLLSATRPEEVGGQSLPQTVAVLANAYLMAGNLSAFGYAMLTTGAAHLIEAFGDETVKDLFMSRMYGGQWTGTMALTEPHAGSSLGDLTTTATPAGDGTYRIVGSKIFISGGDHDVTDNVVNLTLARIAGAPAGTKGISLFAVPNRRLEGGVLVANDVHVTGVIHKIGWRGLPSLALGFGDANDCHGWLVGEPEQGLRYMFQMMNEARILVGVHAAATASVAYHEAVAYAKERRQGRAPGRRDGAPVPIVEHADVRRMLLRQKAIVDGSFGLLVEAARYADLAEHATEPEQRERAQLLLDLLTPVAKTFPAERGFEANALAVQVHGGYGYSSEYLPEAWMRDQKLNTIHEGTSGIQGLDLLGRKAVAKGGAPLRLLGEEIARAADEARAAGLPPAWADAVQAAFGRLAAVTAALGGRGSSGDVDGMLAHSADYLEAFGILALSWQHLRLATAASRRMNEAGPAGFLEGVRCAAQYWIATELPRVDLLARLCEEAEDSYVRLRPDWL